MISNNVKNVKDSIGMQIHANNAVLPRLSISVSYALDFTLRIIYVNLATK